MGSKILLGLLMGFLAGASAKAYTTANENPVLAPVDRGWFDFSARTTPLVAILWVIHTFFAYPAVFVLWAIAEIIIGALAAGFISHQARVIVAFFALPASIIAWVIL